MHQLNLGARVRVTRPPSSFNCRIGRIIHIIKPFVADERAETEAFTQLPLYEVQFEDGTHECCRGRELEPLERNGAADDQS